ncbi:PorT family protein [Mangrovimonas spongiae]|uniref:PorT family protein n=1 Tax=Mangrovimonas spongiae TaxID=2494697 RepID=A0A3R9NYB6_9FLAO|nr:PorT family protein [Mangrovimonas spongiae]RSK40312.1 PorT family protein [Mangrovimonas spongiae]
MGWKNNPTSFKYKLAKEGKAQTLNIQQVNEFSIDRHTKFIKATINIDRSSEHTNKLTKTKDPVYKEETVFLKLLVEGKANLYSFKDGEIIRYFYSLDNSTPIMLIYKKYLRPVSDNDNLDSPKYVQGGNFYVQENNEYKQQIWENLNCDDLDLEELRHTEYREKSLIKVFKEYNTCKTNTYTVYKGNNKAKLHLSAKIGLQSASLKMSNSQAPRDVDFGNNTNITFGLETELVLPFNHNKWSVYLEPTYQSYKSEGLLYYTNYFLQNKSTNVEVEYASIEIPFGVKYYSFLSEKSKLFLNAAYVFDVELTNKFYSEERSDLVDLEGKSKGNFSFGIGYKYNNRYSIEFRYQTSQELLDEYVFYNTDYKSLSLCLGYTFL